MKQNNINSLEENVEDILDKYECEWDYTSTPQYVKFYREEYELAKKELQSLLTTHEQQAVEEWKRELGFYGFVRFIKEILTERYPLDIFDGSSGGAAPVFTSELWGAINKLEKFLEENPNGN